MKPDPMNDPVIFQANADEPGFEKDKWYFWNETWSEAHGPYESAQEARRALTEYAANL